MPVDVVWFKRDLRARDHVPLLSASLSGRPVICLYILETERLEQDDTDPIHIQWELDCAADLSRTLNDSGASLHYGLGDATEVLEAIHLEHGIETVSYTHLTLPTNREV